mmetsp:Transcript_29628/g.52023  ORF Transcript_29628/g.52023 Transcript_29628/m.52023 type:complete len:615 (-) Transcript_29628:65-1909(-)
MAAQLEGAAVDLLALREHTRSAITKMLSSVKQDKILILDKTITGPLGMLAEMAMLKRLGAGQIYHLGIPVSGENKNIIFLTRPTIQNMHKVADQVHKDCRSKPPIERKYVVFVTPRVTKVCTKVLKDRAVLGDVTLKSVHMGFIPVDSDVLSLETDHYFRDVFLNFDLSGLWDVAHSIMKLELFFGVIPVLKAKGEHSCSIVRMIKRMQKEANPDLYLPGVPEIDECVLIDRTTDMVTPMLTQMTYEGIIDELIGVKNSCVEVDASVTSTSKASKNRRGKSFIKLNSEDHLYQEIRDFHYRNLGSWLHQKAGEVRKRYNEVKSSKAVKSASESTIVQMKDVVKKLKTTSAEHNYLQTHSNLAHHLHEKVKKLTFDQKIDKEMAMVFGSENVEDYIESLMGKGEMRKVGRLLCLLTQCRSVYPKRLAFLFNEFIQSFGYQYMFTLQNLQSIGGIADINKRCQWPTIRKRFNLWTENVNLKQPKDISYVYAGYAPLSARIVEYSRDKGGWGSTHKDALELLPGPAYQTTQHTAVKRSKSPRMGGSSSSEGKRLPVILVVFVGGVTYAEISAIRKLGQLYKRRYIIATTNFTNGDKIVGAMLEPNMKKAKAGTASRR